MKKKYNKIWRNTAKYDSCLPPVLPKEKFITTDSKVCAMGSCFADEMGRMVKIIKEQKVKE